MASVPSSRSRSRSGSPTSRPTSCRGARHTARASASRRRTFRPTSRSGASSPPATAARSSRSSRSLASAHRSRATVTVEVNGQARTFNDGEGITFSEEHGRQADVVADHGAVRRLRADVAVGKARRLRQASTPRGRWSCGWGQRGRRLRRRDISALLSASARSRAATDKGAIAIIGPAGGGGAGGQGRGGAAAATPAPGGCADSSGLPGAPPRGRRSRARRRRRRRRFHDRSAVRRQGHAGGQRRGCVLRVPLQRVRAEVRRSSRRRPRTASRCRPSRSRASKSHSTWTPTTRWFARASPTTSSASSEGSDPKLKDTYVAYGAHYDHTGYREGRCRGREGRTGPSQSRRSNQQRRRRRRLGDGSDAWSIARGVCAGAKAEALGCCSSGTPARKSACSGREYNADYPVVPLEKIVAQLDMDMVGRNRNDDAKQANAVLVVARSRQRGAPQHQRGRQRLAARPMTLNYE